MRILLAAAAFAVVAISSSLGQAIFPDGHILYPDVVPGKPLTVQMGDTRPSALNPVYALETSNLILNCSDFLKAHPGGSITWYQRLRTSVNQTFSAIEPYVVLGDQPSKGAGPPTGPFRTIVEIKSATLSNSAASGNSGLYICQVCATADKSHVPKCNNATIDVRVTRQVPFTTTTALPVCVTDSQIADPFIDPLIVTCAVSNAAQDNAISYTIYMNGTLLVAAGKQEVNNLNFSPFVKIYGPGVTAVTYNNPADFNAFGTYTCVASTIWGTSNTTINFGICNMEPQIAACPYPIQPVVDQPIVPVGCDVCLQSGSKVQLDCTAKLGAHISETILRYKWSFANTGVSTGVTSPLYTVNGVGQFSCSVTNSGLSTNKTSNVYLYVKSPPTITITSGTLGGDPSGCSRLTGVATSGADLCPFVGDTLSVACKGAGVTVMKNRVSLNVSTLALQVSGVGDSGNYSCGDGGLCDAAQSTKSIAVFSPAQVDVQSNIGAGAFGAGRSYSAQTITDGTAVTLVCPTTGVDTPSTHWEYIAPQNGDTVGTALPSGAIQQTKVTDGNVVSTLTFTFNASYVGTYVCLTSNAAGSDEGFVVLRQVETYSWTAGAWSPCNIDCEQGVRSRRVICRSNWDGSAVADSFCTGSSPARQEKCNNVSCILFQPVWYGTEWSGCSQDCGGYRTRLVVCLIPQTKTVVSNDRCPSLGPRPPTTEFCQNKCCVEDTYPEFCQQYVKGTDLCLQDRYKQICCCSCGLTIIP
ncbi:hypothetical protein EMCRGX_G029845 [Ephydatia muelleri]